MKKIKKVLAGLISSAVLCSCIPFMNAGAATSYIYGDQYTVFELIAIRRSLINDDGQYTIDDYKAVRNFLLKKTKTIVKKVTVAFDTEGYDTSSYEDPEILDAAEYYCGLQMKIPQATLTREGCIHGGWMYDGVVYQAGQYFTIPDCDVVFTPYWFINRSITYYAGDYDDIVGSRYSIVTGIEGTNFDLAAPSRFSRKGYTLIGWLCSYDGKVYATNSKYVVPASDVTFTAVWKAMSVEISIAANNGNFNDRYTEIGECGSEFIFPECEFENGDKTFAGWKCDGVIYQPGDTMIIPALTSGEKVVITATWK